MSTIRSGLTAVGLAALAVGTFSPAAALAAPAPTAAAEAAVASAAADGAQARRLPAPTITSIETRGADEIVVQGIAHGATLVGATVPDGRGGGTGVVLGRFGLILDREHLGKTATITAFGPQGKSEPFEVLLALREDAAPVTPATPVLHAVSRYDDEHLVIEGTVVHDPMIFQRMTVQAKNTGQLVYDSPDENGAFSLKVPIDRAGQMIDVQASQSGLESEVVSIELVETEGNTASEVFPLEVASPAADAVVLTGETVFAGSGIPNSEISVTRDVEGVGTDSALCETRVLSSGDWSCTSTTLPAGSYETTVTETPTWKSAATQRAGTAFSVAADLLPGEMPVTPQLSSVELENTGELAVRVIAHNSGDLRMTVGDEEIDTVAGAHGRFTFHVDPELLGETVVITGLRGEIESPSLEAALTLLEAPAGSPLQAPRVHQVRERSDDAFTVYATTDYFPDEYAVPGVLAKVGDDFVSASEASWNGATFIRIDSEHAGEQIDLYTVRGDGLLSPATTFTLAETEGNTAPGVFPLDVVSPAEGETVGADTRTFQGEGIPGSRIVIADDGVTRAGALGAASVLADGTWTIEVDAPLAMGDHTMTVTETPYWQTLAPIVSTRSFTVSDEADDESDDDRTDLAVTSHADGGRYSTGIATFTGRGTPEARLTAANQWGTPMGSTRVDEDGDWSFTRNLGPTSAGYDITFTMTPTTGAPTLLTLHLDYEAPSRPLTVTSHVDGESYREGMARFTGTGTVGAQLVSTNQWGTQMGKATIGSDGTWAFSRNLGPTNPGYVLTFVATHGSDEQRTTVTLTHQKGDLVDVQISSPVIRDGGISEAHRTVTFRGTATPFATVVGKNQWGTPFGSTTASSTGAFAFDRYVGPAGTTYELTFEQKATDGTTKTTTGIDFVTGR